MPKSPGDVFVSPTQPLSYALTQSPRMDKFPPMAFQRREDWQPKKPACSLFRQFDVNCLCGSHNIKIVAESDDEGLKLYLFCLGCRQREELPVN